MRIIVDAMGGDNAPDVPVKTSVKAINNKENIDIVLVGKKEVIEEKLAGLKYDESRLEIIDAREIITNDEEPVKAVKQKKDASLVVAAKLLSEGKGDAMLSMGSTGALLAAGILIVGRIKGVLRPALGTLIPTDKGGKLMLDVGANTNCRSQNLLQFAMMGRIYMNKVMGVEKPKIGLANNGVEEGKGNDLTKETYQLLKASESNFIGNLEGREMMQGDADVIVCDGFTGNIILKTLEGMGKVVSKNLKEIFKGGILKTLGGLFVLKGLKEFKKKMDYREYGGAPLMGLKKPVIKGHGSSDEKAAYMTLMQIEKVVLGDITKEIEEAVNRKDGINELREN